MWIGDFILGDDPRPAAAVAALAFTDKLSAAHQAASRDIEHRHIAEDIIERFILWHVFRGLADDKRELGFGLIHHAGRNVAQLDRFPGADKIGRLVKILIGEIVGGALRTSDIITEGGEKLPGSRERRMDIDAVNGYAALLGHDFFEAAAIFAPAFDDLFHDALRSFGFARAHAIAHIDDPVAIFDDADPVI